VRGVIGLLTDLNQRLIEVKEKQRKKVKWEEKLKKSKEFYTKEQKKAEILYDQLQKEEKDVEKLEGLSLSGLFYTFLGKKLEQLDKEKQEALAVKLKYDEATETLEDVKKEMKEVEVQWITVRNADTEYEETLKEKERLIHDQDSIWSEELYECTEKEAELTSNLKEYQEAIGAGRSSVHALDQAIQSLEKAEGWATWDMVGGGMISTAIKHSHVDDSKQHVHHAQNRLRHFQDELADVEQHFQLTFEMGNLLTFADYFFDGLIVDWVVRGKIKDSLEQTKQARYQVSGFVKQLEEQKHALDRELREVQKQRVTLLEQAR
jgi:DNA repair exonuclease SbcCD ATPase subunit